MFENVISFIVSFIRTDIYTRLSAGAHIRGGFGGVQNPP